MVRDIDLGGMEPAAALARLKREPFAFLLESSAGGQRWARYSFLGTDPAEAWRYTGRRIERWTRDTGWRSAGETTDPVGHLGELVRGRPAPPAGLPPFTGGAVGYFAYDVVRTLEQLPEGRQQDAGLPDGLFLMVDNVLVIDREEGSARIYGDDETAAAWCRRLSGASTTPLRRLHGARPEREIEEGTTSYPDDAFMRDVRVVKDHIAAGDIFQAVLSRRTEVRAAVDPLRLFACLRELNPAPYLFALELDGFAIVGSSPEVLVRVEDREVTVRPIAGTRGRGPTPEADAALEAELLADPKERAEHLMLVDLGRNDVGRVARFGSVRVAESMVIERYAHVRHIVSEVRGILAEGRDAVDALKATFPAGTVSGAPKVRAMQILAELEPVRRGPYAGAVGYLGWGARSLDTAITIRTCVVLRDRVIVQAGAGIVADSDPARELAETRQKAQGALRAIAMARADLDRG